MKFIVKNVSFFGMGKTAQPLPSPALSTMFHLPFWTFICHGHGHQIKEQVFPLGFCWWLVLLNNGWVEKDNTSKMSG